MASKIDSKYIEKKCGQCCNAKKKNTERNLVLGPVKLTEICRHLNDGFRNIISQQRNRILSVGHQVIESVLLVIWPQR